MCLITLVFLLLSKLFKKSNLPFICGIAAFMIMTLCKVFFTNESGQKLNLFNPISFLTSYNVFSDYNILNIFGNPVFEWQVMIGTFALAMAFAGNDLVNFIGVPLAGFSDFPGHKNYRTSY